ncbi:MAG TPA: response regulator transcription factor [Opitutaceae bacterium]
MRIVIVEDQAIFREMLRNMCVTKFGHEVLGEAPDGREAVRLADELSPELMLLDLELPVMDGFAVIVELKAKAGCPKLLVFSSYCDEFTVLRLEQLGVEGFVDKNTSTASALESAFAAIERGGRFFSATFQQVRTARRANSASFDKLLSEREQRVLALIGELLSDEKIGARLGISDRTAETHRFNIMRKLGINTRLDLERYARDHGFTQSVVKPPPGSGLR